jgi:hypothetical protein
VVELRDEPDVVAMREVDPVTKAPDLVVGVDARLPVCGLPLRQTYRLPATIMGVPASTMGS